MSFTYKVGKGTVHWVKQDVESYLGMDPGAVSFSKKCQVSKFEEVESVV